MYDFKYYKLEIAIPGEHLKELFNALRAADAGHIGKYDSCSYYFDAVGTWRPLENADPYLGEIGKISNEPAVRIDVHIRAEDLEKTIAAIREVHPFEDPGITVIPVIDIF